jgi:hypothetical protein
VYSKKVEKSTCILVKRKSSPTAVLQRSLIEIDEKSSPVWKSRRPAVFMYMKSTKVELANIDTVRLRLIVSHCSARETPRNLIFKKGNYWPSEHAEKKKRNEEKSSVHCLQNHVDKKGNFVVLDASGVSTCMAAEGRVSTMPRPT